MIGVLGGNLQHVPSALQDPMKSTLPRIEFWAGIGNAFGILHGTLRIQHSGMHTLWLQIIAVEIKTDNMWVHHL